ncbi:hypothetical protein [Pseudomonas sp. CC6-YY-74]|uniref:hypothetical protein n=1 Tax=Pseudomonas sp. CC6-YY-74 TaxID=1930532 RepID=UPI0012AB4E58|nr:hypothetical protein [Pseudomonas sp. CC6-YY-74]
MKNILSKVAKPKKDFYNHSYISLKNKYFFHSVGKAANSTVKHFLYGEELAGTGISYKTVHDRLSSPLISPYQLTESALEEVLFGGGIIDLRLLETHLVDCCLVILTGFRM